MNRKKLIEYIRKNDRNYDYGKVKFGYYTDEELQMIYKRILRQKEDEQKEKSKRK